MTTGTWNILMLPVREEAQGRGRGPDLIRAIKTRLATQNAGLIVAGTSGTDDFEQTQRFYEENGLIKVVRIPDFYSSGDDKIVFSLSL